MNWLFRGEHIPRTASQGHQNCPAKLSAGTDPILPEGEEKKTLKHKIYDIFMYMQCTFLFLCSSSNGLVIKE